MARPDGGAAAPREDPHSSMTSHGSIHRAEIYGFADASERAYAAMTYLKVYVDDERRTISLLQAKSRSNSKGLAAALGVVCRGTTHADDLHTDGFGHR